VQRLWRLVNDAAEIAKSAPATRPANFSESAQKIRKAAHGALAKVSSEIEKLHFNVCVAHIYEFANALGAAVNENAKNPAPDVAWAIKEAADILVTLFHPMMPHLAEECWAVLGHKTLVSQATWPAVEEALLVENTVTLPVQINARDAANGDIEAAVLALDIIQRALEGKPPKKVIVVPQRIVNVVA
jgi:leucyl-tRNA synthetase